MKRLLTAALALAGAFWAHALSGTSLSNGSPDISGSFACIYTADARLQNSMATFYSDAWTGKTSLHNFLGKGTDIPVAIETDPTSGETSVRIEGNGKVTLYVENGNSYDLFLGKRDGAGKIWTQPADICFSVDTEKGFLALPGEGMAVICLNQNSLKYSSYDAPEFYPANGWSQVIVEDFAAGRVVQKEYEVYGLKTDSNTLYVFGFFDYPYPIVFNLNTTNGMARAANQAAWTYNGEDFYFVNADTNEPTLYGTFTETSEEFTIMLTDTWMTYNAKYGIKDRGYNTEFTFNLLNNSLITDCEIANEISGEAQNRPVYYNLQGLEVATPAKGHIYIVREGQKVYKTLLR